MRVYLAGPMTGYPEWNFPAFREAAYDLRLRGLQVWSPAERDLEKGFDPHERNLDFDLEEALRDDLQAVLASDYVVVLPGFESSAGALLEVITAEAVGIPWMTCAEMKDLLGKRRGALHLLPALGVAMGATILFATVGMAQNVNALLVH